MNILTERNELKKTEREWEKDIGRIKLNWRYGKIRGSSIIIDERYGQSGRMSKGVRVLGGATIKI